MLLKNYSKSHLIALFAATIVHASLAAWTMLPSKPVVITKQALHVNFVAPSSNNKKTAKKTIKKTIITKKHLNSIAKKKVSLEEQTEKKSEKNMTAGKQTSGRQDPNAIATKSAETAPIFNAAYLKNPAPSYPRYARTRGIQGKVLINVLVTIEGKAKKVELSKSSGSSLLDKAALAAVKQWRFIPAKKGNKSVQANVIVPVEFKII